MNRTSLQHPSWLPILIVAGLAALTTWLGQLADAPVVRDMSGFLHEPDYIVENFQATAFDAAGHPKHRLSAEKLQHFMDDDTTVLEKPSFMREAPGQSALVATSLRGQISGDGQHVHLIDQVRVEQSSMAGEPATIMTTEYLDVMPEAHRMSTNKPLRLHRGTNIVNAQGMQADGNKREVLLTGGVKGIYESRH